MGDVAALLGGADELPDAPVRYAQQRALRQGLGTLYLQHLFLPRRPLGFACTEPSQPARGGTYAKTSSVEESFGFETQTRRKSLSFRGRDVFFGPEPSLEAQIQPSAQRVEPQGSHLRRDR